MTVHALLTHCRSIYNSPQMIRILVAHVLEKPLEWTFTHAQEEVGTEVCQRAIHAVNQLAQGVPPSRILGYREFYGRRFFINEDTLDPRPETELVVDQCLQYIHDAPDTLLLDLCTGSGCIGVSVLSNTHHVRAALLDKSDNALRAAKKNAQYHHVMDRCSWYHQCLLKYTGPLVHVMCANPPYIESHHIDELPDNVRQFDPKMALDGGKDGLDFYRHIVQNLTPFLHEGGYLIMEVGHEQMIAVQEIAQRYYSVVKVCQDLAGINRVIVLKKCKL